MATGSMLSFRAVDVIDWTRELNGRFGLRKEAGEKYYRALGQRLQHVAVKNQQASVLTTRRNNPSKFELMHRPSGRLASAIKSPENVKVSSAGLDFIDEKYMDRAVRYWRAIEHGTRAHVGRYLTITRKERFSAKSPRNVSGNQYGRNMLIVRPIVAQENIERAWREVMKNPKDEAKKYFDSVMDTRRRQRR